MLMTTPLLLRYFWFHSIYSLAASCSLQSAVYGLRSAVCSLRSAVCSLQSAVCGLRCAVCKCHTPCEKAALNQLTPYLKTLAVNRGEKKWHSIETSLIVSMDTILEVVNKRKLTAIVYLDMSKAFDSINHSILL